MEAETIEVYTFSIREKRAKEKYFFADGFDLYDKMKMDFINFIHNSQTGDIPAEKRTLRVPEAEGKFPFWGCSDRLRCVYGIIETGLYGKKILVWLDYSRKMLDLVCQNTMLKYQYASFLMPIVNSHDKADVKLQKCIDYLITIVPLI